MYIGYQINNILESLCPFNDIKGLYSPHYSIFDLLLSECDISLYTYGNTAQNFIDKSSRINVFNQKDLYIHPYSLYVANHPIRYINENYAYILHINSLIFSHDYDSFEIKLEEKFLACEKGFRKSDTIIAFNNSLVQGLNCNKLNIVDTNYSIPQTFIRENIDRKKIGIFAYNKSLSEELIIALHPEANAITKLAYDISSLNKELNEYSIVVELDPASIINVLVAISCGCIGVINDPQDFLKEYRDIPNLYIVKSVGEVQQILNSKIEYQDKELPFKYRQFDQFKNLVNNLLYQNRRKAFAI